MGHTAVSLTKKAIVPAPREGSCTCLQDSHRLGTGPTGWLSPTLALSYIAHNLQANFCLFSGPFHLLCTFGLQRRRPRLLPQPPSVLPLYHSAQNHSLSLHRHWSLHSSPTFPPLFPSVFPAFLQQVLPRGSCCAHMRLGTEPLPAKDCSGSFLRLCSSLSLWATMAPPQAP